MAKKITETSRKGRKKKTHPVVVVVCEGTKTEPTYFRRFREKYRRNIIVDVASKRDNLSNLIQETVKRRNDHIAGLENEEDCSAWCVIDADVDYKTPGNHIIRNNQIKEAQKEAGNVIKIALSNPCFELWFLLHYIYTTSQMRNYNDVMKELSKQKGFEKYEKIRDVFDILEDKLEIAKKNAESLQQHHINQNKTDLFDVSATPYTNIWELIAIIQKSESNHGNKTS